MTCESCDTSAATTTDEFGVPICRRCLDRAHEQAYARLYESSQSRTVAEVKR